MNRIILLRMENIYFSSSLLANDENGHKADKHMCTWNIEIYKVQSIYKIQKYTKAEYSKRDFQLSVNQPVSHDIIYISLGVCQPWDSLSGTIIKTSHYSIIYCQLGLAAQPLHWHLVYRNEMLKHRFVCVWLHMMFVYLLVVFLLEQHSRFWFYTTSLTSFPQQKHLGYLHDSSLQISPTKVFNMKLDTCYAYYQLSHSIYSVLSMHLPFFLWLLVTV